MSIYQYLPAPFVVYADFESILNPVDVDADTTQGVEVGSESSSHVFQEHIRCSVDLYFSGPLAMYRDIRDLQQEAKQLLDEYIATSKRMLPTAT